MKRKLALTFATLIILAMGMAAFAYTTTGMDTGKAAASCCCCSGDSCPMKNKDAKITATGDAKASCDCCGDSCPMKNGDHSMSGMDMKGMDMKHDKNMKDGSCSCCHHDKDKKDTAKAGI